MKKSKIAILLLITIVIIQTVVLSIQSVNDIKTKYFNGLAAYKKQQLSGFNILKINGRVSMQYFPTDTASFIGYRNQDDVENNTLKYTLLQQNDTLTILYNGKAPLKLTMATKMPNRVLLENKAQVIAKDFEKDSLQVLINNASFSCDTIQIAYLDLQLRDSAAFYTDSSIVAKCNINTNRNSYVRLRRTIIDSAKVFMEEKSNTYIGGKVIHLQSTIDESSDLRKERVHYWKK
jgi:hypothetical protein